MKNTLFATTETNFLSPIGYNSIIERFKERLKTDDLPPVSLISAPEGAGKRMVGEYLAGVLVNISDTSYSAIIHHPDIKIISPKLESKKQEITIDQVRQIKEFIYLTPNQAKYKIIIIDAADNLNKNAANSMLKIIEEPPANRIFLILCHDMHKILDTIKSRCQIINLPKLTKNDFFDIMNNQEDNDISYEASNVLYEIFPHQAGKAIEFAKLKGLEILTEIENLIQADKKNQYINIKNFSNQYDFKEISVLKIFFTVINFLTYQKYLAANKSSDTEEIKKLSGYSSKIQKRFKEVISLNLDRKNFVIDSLTQYLTI